MTASLRTKILIGIAVAIAAYVIFVPGDPQTTEPGKSTEHTARLRPTPQTQNGATHAPTAIHTQYLLAHRVAAGEAADSLFAAHSWYTPPPPPPPAAVPVQVVVAPPAPTAPPLPYQFMGSYTPDGGAAVFFLTRADRVYDVRAGDTLENTYSVDGISGNQLLLTYKPLNIQQQLSVGGTQ